MGGHFENILLKCLQNCRVTMLKFLVRTKQLDVNKLLSNGSTVLHEILSVNDKYKDKYNLIRYFLESAKANPNICNCLNETALHYLIEKWENSHEKLWDIFELFLRNGYDINNNDQHRTHLLQLCIQNERKEYLELLLKYNADVNIKNFYGNASVHSYPVLLRNKEKLYDLLGIGYFDLNVRTNMNESAFDLAVKNIDLPALHVLLEYDIEFDFEKLRSQLLYIKQNTKTSFLLCQILYRIYKKYPEEADAKLKSLDLPLIEYFREIREMKATRYQPSTRSFFDFLMADINLGPTMYKIAEDKWFRYRGVRYGDVMISKLFPLFHKVIMKKTDCILTRCQEISNFKIISDDPLKSHFIPYLHTAEFKDDGATRIICLALSTYKFMDGLKTRTHVISRN